MKMHNPINNADIQALIERLNFCHDASLKQIIFLKDRNVNKNGNLVYPFEDPSNTEIKIELILNSYSGAKKDQRVIFRFKEVKRFNFYQDLSFDYSDIFELKFHCEGDNNYNFFFYSTSKKLKCLNIVCKYITCIEK